MKIRDKVILPWTYIWLSATLIIRICKKLPHERDTAEARESSISALSATKRKRKTQYAIGLRVCGDLIASDFALEAWLELGSYAREVLDNRDTTSHSQRLLILSSPFNFTFCQIGLVSDFIYRPVDC